MNDNTLRPTEKEALDTDYYCLTHGTKLSHQQTADIHHRSKRAIQLARRRLEDLGLRTTEPAKGSFLVGHPIEYQDEAEWRAALRARGIEARGAMIAPKSVQKKRPLRGLSSSQVAEASASEAAEAGVSLPQTPAGSTDRCSGEAGESRPSREQKTKWLWDVTYKEKLRKLIAGGWDEDRAKNLAQIGTEHKMAKRSAELKSREEERTKDQRTEEPNSD